MSGVSLFDIQIKSWMLLAADETGFPAVRAIVSSLPNEIPIHAFIELSNGQEKQDLPLRENLSVHWVYRENKLGFTAGLTETIKACELPHTCGGAWIAGEASAVRDIRTHLVKERGFQVSSVQATGYWKQGVNDHKDLALIS